MLSDKAKISAVIAQLDEKKNDSLKKAHTQVNKVSSHGQLGQCNWVSSHGQVGQCNWVSTWAV